MKSVGPDAARDLLLLSLTAGSTDAIGFLALGEAFTSNMTGNTVLLSIHLGQGDYLVAARILGVIVTFLLGATLGAWLGRGVPEKEWSALAFRLIRMEKFTLLVFALGWLLWKEGNFAPLQHFLLGLLAVSMGLQSTALFRLAAPGVATTAITGTLTAMINGIFNLVMLPPEQAHADRERTQFQLGILFLYALGAVISGFCIVHFPITAGLIPLAAIAAVSNGKLRS
jgi:uncharacterized membrane protein YoaK (UPF0700 family)